METRNNQVVKREEVGIIKETTEATKDTTEKTMEVINRKIGEIAKTSAIAKIFSGTIREMDKKLTKDLCDGLQNRVQTLMKRDQLKLEQVAQMDVLTLQMICAEVIAEAKGHFEAKFLDRFHRIYVKVRERYTDFVRYLNNTSNDVTIGIDKAATEMAKRQLIAVMKDLDKCARSFINKIETGIENPLKNKE